MFVETFVLPGVSLGLDPVGEGRVLVGKYVQGDASSSAVLDVSVWPPRWLPRRSPCCPRHAGRTPGGRWLVHAANTRDGGFCLERYASDEAEGHDLRPALDGDRFRAPHANMLAPSRSAAPCWRAADPARATSSSHASIHESRGELEPLARPRIAYGRRRYSDDVRMVRVCALTISTSSPTQRA
jgi:hypothetical protein